MYVYAIVFSLAFPIKFELSVGGGMVVDPFLVLILRLSTNLTSITLGQPLLGEKFVWVVVELLN